MIEPKDLSDKELTKFKKHLCNQLHNEVEWDRRAKLKISISMCDEELAKRKVNPPLVISEMSQEEQDEIQESWECLEDARGKLI
jgi:hypothetical protein